jgi:multidrug efflux pump subunit AcrA (membrane-fusion protein)
MSNGRGERFNGRAGDRHPLIRSGATVKQSSVIAACVSLSVAAAACGRLAAGDPKGSEDNAKPVATTLVVKNSVRRSVDVVGTLAAVDQVTISSEAEGTVRAILADLGDRVAANQVLIQLDHEKQQYTYEQQQAALARTLAQYGAQDPEHLPPIEQTPDVQKAKAELEQAQQGFIRPRICRHGPLSRSRPTTTREPRCNPSRRATTRRFKARATCAPASRRPRPR